MSKKKATQQSKSGTYAIDAKLPHMVKLAKIESQLPPATQRVERTATELLNTLPPKDVVALAERLRYAYRIGRTVTAVEQGTVIEKGTYVRITSGTYEGHAGLVAEVGKIRCRVDVPEIGYVYLFTSEVAAITGAEAKKIERALKKVG